MQKKPAIVIVERAQFQHVIIILYSKAFQIEEFQWQPSGSKSSHVQ